MARTSHKLRCIGCGCTDERACPGGCHWVSLAPPTCSACVDPGLLPNAAPIDACPAGAIGMHDLVWLNSRSGFCSACRAPFVALEVA